MKILQLFCRYQERGGEEAAVETIGGYLRMRHTVADLFFDNAELASLRGPAKLLLPLRFFWNPPACRKFDEMVVSFQPELIVIHNLFPAGSAGVLIKALRTSIPVVHYIHNFRPFSVNAYCWADGRIEPAGLKCNFWPEIRAGSWQQSRMKTALFAAVLYLLHFAGVWKRIPCWIAVSGFLAGKFIDAGMPRDRVHVLHFGKGDLPPPALPEGIPVTPTFLFLGRLIEEKGVNILLDAWRRYCGEGGKGRLIIAGSGPLEPFLKLRVAELKGVTLAGQVCGEQKESLLRNCTAVVVPSLWWEAFGLVVYEGYTYSKPVLVAKSGGLTELVEHGQTGWIHEPDDSRGLARHLFEAASDRAEAARRGSLGYARLVRNASVEEWLDGFERIVAPLLKTGPESV